MRVESGDCGSPTRPRAGEGRADGEPAVAHVRKHVDVLDVRMQPDAAVDLDVRGDAAAQRDAGSPGGGTALRTRG